MSLKNVHSIPLGWSGTAGSREGERGAQQLHRDSSQAVLCVKGRFPAFTGNAHIGNRFSLTVDLSQSPAESTLSCSGLHTQKNEEGIEGGGSFETHLPHLTG